MYLGHARAHAENETKTRSDKCSQRARLTVFKVESRVSAPHCFVIDRKAKVKRMNASAHIRPERSLDTVVRAVSAAVLPVWVDFTSLKGLPCECAPGPATTRRGMLVTNGYC